MSITAGGLGLGLICQTRVFDVSTAEDVDGEDSWEDEEGEEDEEQSGGINIGKAFLLPRAKLSLYDQEIFASRLLEGRDKVSPVGVYGSLSRRWRFLYLGSMISAQFVLRFVPCRRKCGNTCDPIAYNDRPTAAINRRLGKEHWHVQQRVWSVRVSEFFLAERKLKVLDGQCITSTLTTEV